MGRQVSPVLPYYPQADPTGRALPALRQEVAEAWAAATDFFPDLEGRLPTFRPEGLDASPSNPLPTTSPKTSGATPPGRSSAKAPALAPQEPVQPTPVPPAQPATQSTQLSREQVVQLFDRAAPVLPKSLLNATYNRTMPGVGARPGYMRPLRANGNKSARKSSTNKRTRKSKAKSTRPRRGTLMLRAPRNPSYYLTAAGKQFIMCHSNPFFHSSPVPRPRSNGLGTSPTEMAAQFEITGGTGTTNTMYVMVIPSPLIIAYMTPPVASMEADPTFSRVLTWDGKTSDAAVTAPPDFTAFWLEYAVNALAARITTAGPTQSAYANITATLVPVQEFAAGKINMNRGIKLSAILGGSQNNASFANVCAQSGGDTFTAVPGPGNSAYLVSKFCDYDDILIDNPYLNSTGDITSSPAADRRMHAILFRVTYPTSSPLLLDFKMCADFKANILSNASVYVPLAPQQSTSPSSTILDDVLTSLDAARKVIFSETAAVDGMRAITRFLSQIPTGVAPEVSRLRSILPSM